MQIVLAIILITVFGWICWSLIVGPVEFVIRYANGRTRFSGRFAGARRAEIEEFFKREFPDRTTIKVSAVKTPQNGTRFVIRGSIPAGDRQRIRNFLQTIK